MAHDIAALNAAAAKHHQQVLAAIYYPDGRVSNEVRGLNWSRARLRDLHVTLVDGRWSVSADGVCVEGHGAVGLVATLADVSMEVAARFLERILPVEAA